MCRWIVYYGNDVTVSDAIGTHGHGLVNVANAPVWAPGFSKEDLFDQNDIIVNHQENGDGFGIGFYSRDKSLLLPAVLRDCKPIWHSNNLDRIAGTVKSPLVFGHVRKAFNFGSIAEQNCHPFSYGVYMFMHNGVVWKFHKVRVSILGMISELFDSVSKNHDIENEIQGTTDTEALFFLILGLVAKLKNSLDFSRPTCTTEELTSCMEKGINLVLGLVKDRVGNYGEGSRLNLAISDGTQVVVTRFRNALHQPPSLYLTLRQKNAKTLRGATALSTILSLDDEKKVLENEASEDEFFKCPINASFGYTEFLPEVVMIASEPMNPEEEQFWKLVPRNSIISIKSDRTGGLMVKSELLNVPESLFMSDARLSV